MDLEEEEKDNNLSWSDGTRMVDTDLTDLFNPEDIYSRVNGVYMAVLSGTSVEITKKETNISWNVCQLNPFFNL